MMTRERLFDVDGSCMLWGTELNYVDDDEDDRRQERVTLRALLQVPDLFAIRLGDNERQRNILPSMCVLWILFIFVLGKMTRGDMHVSVILSQEVIFLLLIFSLTDKRDENWREK